MTKVLIAGESWITEATHYKGYDSFTTVTFHTGVDPLQDALEAEGIEVEHLPAHEVPARFPGSVDELGAYDAVLLSDIGANSLLLSPATWLHGRRSPNRLAALATWVQQGGGLAMAGGYLSFQGFEGKARYHRTAVEAVMPAMLDPWDDRVELPEGGIPEIIDATHPILQGVTDAWPALLGYNRFRCRDDAHLIATINEDPLLAVREVGNGRTLAWASDIGPHWCPEEFCKWDGYRQLFGAAVRWVAGEL